MTNSQTEELAQLNTFKINSKARPSTIYRVRFLGTFPFSLHFKPDSIDFAPRPSRHDYRRRCVEVTARLNCEVLSERVRLFCAGYMVMLRSLENSPARKAVFAVGNGVVAEDAFGAAELRGVAFDGEHRV